MNFSEAKKAYTDGAVFAAFDLETTGLNPNTDRIVEIGAVKFDRKGLIARFSALVNPGIPMPAEAGKVNGISDEMLRGKPPLDEVFPDFLLFIRDAVVIAHNAPFDCGFINANLGKLRIESPTRFFRKGEADFSSLPNPIACTLTLSRNCFPGKRSYSLQNLAAELGILALDSHRPEDDARLCMEIFLRIIHSPFG